MMTYRDTGVNYDALDPFKRVAQAAALKTAGNISRLNTGLTSFREFSPSRGESAYLIETLTNFLALVIEGLGTKNKVADIMYALTGKTYYDQVAQCTVAMIVNDLITLGALPLTVAMHVASGSSDWFKDEKRSGDLIQGWQRACNLARCTWGPGETPALQGVVMSDTVEISGSAMGIIEPKGRLIAGPIQHGDAIVIVESSGIHANGLTLARKIGESLGYLTELSDGRPYGEALLDPTHIYVGLVEDCLNVGIDIHYAVNITGHGWRKFMRSVQDLTYVIDTLPTQLPIFDFIQQHGPVNDEEAYGNLNMGAGFALYLNEAWTDRVISIAQGLGQRAFVAGYVETGEKKVVINPKGLVFKGETLAVR